MGQAQPAIEMILRQVEAELMAMREAGETGTVTVHVGPTQLQIECNAKRKREPVKMDAPHVSYIRQLRAKS